MAYRRWLTTVCFDHPASQIVLLDYIHAVTHAEAVHCLTKRSEELAPTMIDDSIRRGRQAMRGLAFIAP